MTSAALLDIARQANGGPSYPRRISVAQDNDTIDVRVENNDIAGLVASGLLFRCGEHELHLNPTRLWTADEVERLLIAAGKARVS